LFDTMGVRAEFAGDEAARVNGVQAGFGDKFLDKRAEGLCLRDRGLDAVVLDQRAREVREQCIAMVCAAAELNGLSTMTHGNLMGWILFL